MAFVDLNRSVKLITKMMRRPSFPLRKNNKKKTKGSKKVKSQVIDGVYHLEDSAYQCKRKALHRRQLDSFSTVDTWFSDDDCSTEFVVSPSETSSSHQEDEQQGLSSKRPSSPSDSTSASSWVSSGSPTHHNGAPRLVRSTPSQRGLNLSDDELMGRIMLKSRTLPRPNHGYFVSNHVMINNERQKRTLAPLKRSPKLDEIAKKHAMEMADNQKLIHPNLDDLHQQQQQSSTDCSSCCDQQQQQRIGANVGCGPDIEHIQKEITSSESNLNNIIDRRFVYMGIGTAKSVDGSLYLCQIFGN